MAKVSQGVCLGVRVCGGSLVKGSLNEILSQVDTFSSAAAGIFYIRRSLMLVALAKWQVSDSSKILKI